MASDYAGSVTLATRFAAQEQQRAKRGRESHSPGGHLCQFIDLVGPTNQYGEEAVV